MLGLRGIPKWMGYFMGNPMKMDELYIGLALFHPIYMEASMWLSCKYQWDTDKF